MADKFPEAEELNRMLRFHPFPIPDPVPFWIVPYLDRVQIGRLALIETEMRNEVLEAALKANAQASEILKGITK